MSENVREKLDERIYNNLVKLEYIRNCETFLIYASSPDEVDTRRFIKKMLGDGKIIAIPKCIGRNMVFISVNSLDELIRSSFGVDEPSDGIKITDFHNTVCIVPALRFDRDGYRLGWGGGFYDRFLSGYTGHSIGICYEDNCGNVPTDIYDIAVNSVITENGIYK